MVVMGFTVTFVRRRQVPNTYGSPYIMLFAVSSLGKPAMRRRVASVLACVPA